MTASPGDMYLIGVNCVILWIGACPMYTQVWLFIFSLESTPIDCFIHSKNHWKCWRFLLTLLCPPGNANMASDFRESLNKSCKMSHQYFGLRAIPKLSIHLSHECNVGDRNTKTAWNLAKNLDFDSKEILLLIFAINLQTLRSFMRRFKGHHSLYNLYKTLYMSLRYTNTEPVN